jgi:hypothetical protein
MTTTEQIETYEGELQFRGASGLPLRGVMYGDHFLGEAESSEEIVVDIDMLRRGDALAGFVEITTPQASMPVGVAGKIDHGAIVLSGPGFEGRLERSA